MKTTQVSTYVSTVDIRSDIKQHISQIHPVANTQKNRFERIKHPQFCGQKESSKSLIGRILSWIASSKISVFTAYGILRSTRFWMLSAVSPKYSRNKTDKTIDELSGSLHLSKVVHLISPVIAHKIQESLLALDLHEALNIFFKDEHLSLQIFVDLLLSRMYVNIANNIKENSLRIGCKETIHISLIDVISLLLEIIGAHLPDINANFDRLNSISDPKRRNQKLCKLFSPITEDFLDVALPNGVKDLGVAEIPFVSEAFWKGFKKNILPAFSIEIYRQIAPLLKFKNKEELKQKFGGKSLVCFAETVGIKTAESIALLFANATDELNKKNQGFAKGGIIELIEGFTSLISGSEQMKSCVANWLAEQLSAFGKSSDVYIKSIWKILSRYVEIFLVHVFQSLLTLREGQGSLNKEPQDALSCILLRLLSISSGFFDQNSIAIAKRTALLSDYNLFEEDPELLTLFKSYADELLIAMGLYKKEVIPFPSIMQEYCVMILREMTSRFLLRQYFMIGVL